MREISLLRVEMILRHYSEVKELMLFQMTYSKTDLNRWEHIMMHCCILKAMQRLEILYLLLEIKQLLQSLRVIMVMYM